MKRGIVLFGHGSRDPAWRRPMDEVAERLSRAAPDRPVACAFLELQAPDLPTAVAALAQAGAQAVTVFPLFLGVGRHAREDLPQLVGQVRAAHPGLAIDVLPSAGEHPAVLDLLAQLAEGSTP